MGRDRRRVHPHRTASRATRRQGDRARSPLLRDPARQSRYRARDQPPELLHLRRRGCVRRRIRRRGRQRRCRSAPRRVDRQGIGRRPRQPRRHRHRRDHRRGVLQGRHVRADVPLRVRRTAPRSARCVRYRCRCAVSCKSNCASVAPTCSGTAPYAAWCAPNPTYSTDGAGAERVDVTRGPAAIRGARRASRAGANGHASPRSRTAPRLGDDRVGRRSRRRTARHVRRSRRAALRRRGTAHRRVGRRHASVAVERPAAAQRRLQRRRGAARARTQHGADSLRRDAARRVGRHRAPARHGHQWRVGIGLLPLLPAGLRRPTSDPVARRRRSGVRDDAGLQRLASRRMVRRGPRSVHAESDPVAARSRRAPPTRSGATRPADSRRSPSPKRRTS